MRIPARDDPHLTVDITTLFLNRPDSIERIFAPPLDYVVNNLSCSRFNSIESSVFPHTQKPKTLTKDQVQQLLDACSNQRDRLLVWLLYESAMRIGEALALFVEDVDVAENCLHICDRGALENEAEIKTIHTPRTIDVSSDLIDEIVAYVGRAHTADVVTNHLFLKLSGERAKQAMTYEDVDGVATFFPPKSPLRIRCWERLALLALLAVDGICIKHGPALKAGEDA
ncbi:MAG: tyrosine-type recombinase/integrase [Ktedonobacteraceae bacterium]